jgi:hypothetical protein
MTPVSAFRLPSPSRILIDAPPGIGNLFDSLITAIITKKDIIERENELKKRDSVFLSSTPTWATQDDEEDAAEKPRSTDGWTCCGS